MMETSYRVVGMTCEHCEHRVQDEVAQVDGVESARANAGSGTLTVTSSAGVDTVLIGEAVEEAGYELAHG